MGGDVKELPEIHQSGKPGSARNARVPVGAMVARGHKVQTFVGAILLIGAGVVCAAISSARTSGAHGFERRRPYDLERDRQPEPRAAQWAHRARDWRELACDPRAIIS
jgi:hypothetical protein